MPSYEEYRQAEQVADYAGEPILVAADTFLTTDSTAVQEIGTLDGQDAVFTGETGRIVWEVNVPADGRYSMKVLYYPVEGYGGNMERHLYIDGEIPCDEAQFLTFQRVWADESGAVEFAQDSRGNEIRPTQVEAPRWVEATLADATGYVNGSLDFALTKGVHRLALESVKEPMAIAAVILQAPEQTPTYKEYAENVAGQNTCTQQYIEIPAEHAVEKSDSSLYAITDRTSPMTDPQDPSKIRLNTIGGTKWQNVGQTITWRFEVTESGYYRVALRFKKDQFSGMFSSRSLRIDDRLLCEEQQYIADG